VVHPREEEQKDLQPICFLNEGTLAEAVRSYISTSGYMKKLAFIVAALAIYAGLAIAHLKTIKQLVRLTSCGFANRIFPTETASSPALSAASCNSASPAPGCSFTPTRRV
jgi:hypothetical protein